MGRRIGNLLVAVAVVSVGFSVLAAPASAGRKCKSEVVSMASGNEDAAATGWHNKVKHQFGTAWADLDLAKDKRYSGQNPGLFTIVILTAIPCKRT